MGIRNNHWYNLNELRNYPLDDNASCLSDNGDRLPSGLIQDLQLRWPEAYGSYGFVSAATLTTGIVTVLIEAAHSLSNTPANSTLIAGVTVPLNTLTLGRTLPFQTFQEGVGGFICFGSGVTGPPYKGVFSSPNQSLLTPRAARANRPAPIPGIRVLNSQTLLKDIVPITAEAPLSITRETRVINGVEYSNVLVFRLEELADTVEDNYLDSVFNEFSGPCSARVDSKTCGDPQPLEKINGIGPDCDGVLTLNFQGCAEVGRNVDDCGVVIDCSYGLSNTCEPPYLPDLATGKLPSEVPPAIIPPPVPPEPPVVPEDSISESIRTVFHLPYCDLFDGSGLTPDGFNLIGTSSFGFVSDESPSQDACCTDADPDNFDCFGESVSLSQSCSSSGIDCRTIWEYVPPPGIVSSFGVVSLSGFSQKNIALFVNDVQSLYRKYTVDLKVLQTSVGAQKNGGILINYRVDADTGLPTYYLALMNITTGIFGIYYFNGVGLIQVSTTSIGDFKTADWYRMTFSCVPATSLTQLVFTATVDGIDDPTITASIEATVSLSNWPEDTGTAGLYVDRSNTYYSFWRIEEAS